MPRRYAFGRPRLTDRQIEVLMLFDKYRRHVAGRPTRPSFAEAALELGVSKAGLYSHLDPLFVQGYFDVRVGGMQSRRYGLSEKGVTWCRRKRRRLVLVKLKRTRTEDSGSLKVDQ